MTEIIYHKLENAKDADFPLSNAEILATEIQTLIPDEPAYSHIPGNRHLALFDPNFKTIACIIRKFGPQAALHECNRSLQLGSGTYGVPSFLIDYALEYQIKYQEESRRLFIRQCLLNGHKNYDAHQKPFWQASNQAWVNFSARVT